MVNEVIEANIANEASCYPSAHHFSSTSSMVSGSGTFSVSGRKQAKHPANTAAPPYTILGRAGSTWEKKSISTTGNTSSLLLFLRFDLTHIQDQTAAEVLMSPAECYKTSLYADDLML